VFALVVGPAGIQAKGFVRVQVVKATSGEKKRVSLQSANVEKAASSFRVGFRRYDMYPEAI